MKSSGDERLDPSGPMVGVSLKVTGSAQGYVLYYLAADTAARLAEEFSSRALTPGGAADLMQLVVSNALEGMKPLSQAIEIKVGDIFACAESGFSGDEEWTYSSRFKTVDDVLSVYGADDIYGLIFLVAMTDTDIPPMPDVAGIIEAAKASIGTSAAGVNANIAQHRPCPLQV